MNKAAKISKRVLREATLWLLAGVIAFQGLFNLLPYFGINVVQPIQAAVAPNGNLYYGDLDATADKLRMQVYTDSSNTFGGEINTTLPGTPSGDTNWVVAKQSPVRNEQIQAFVQDGTTADLFVTRCVDTCDAQADYSSEWSNAGVGPALTCDGTAGSCYRTFDLGYEQLSGQAMVVYGDNVSATSGTLSKIYYCIWDGSAWGPVSNCAPTDGTNDLPALTNFTGIPEWIRVIPMGEQLAKNRSDRILVLASTGGNDIGAWIWNGSDWTTLSSTLITNGGISALDQRPFDGAWETNSGDAMVLFGNSTTEDTTPAAYKIYTSGTNTWDSSEAAIPAVSTQCNAVATTSYISRWIELASSPSSDIIIAGLVGSDQTTISTTPAFFPYHWSGSAWSQGGGSGNSTACDDAIKTAMNKQVGVGFEKYNNGTEFGIAATADGGTTLTVRYTTFTAPSTWAALATAFSTTDDSSAVDLYAAPNAGSAGADVMHLLARDIDCDVVYHRRWTGSAWNGGNPTTGSIPPNCTNTASEAPGYTYVNKMYAAWSKNWRWYNGTDTASVPTNAFDPENVRPRVGNAGNNFRLRINVAELTNGASETDSRKKLQFVSADTCPDPDTCTSSSWTDVGQIGSAAIWRYVDLTCSPTDCADNTLLTGTVLTGTNGTCTGGNGCGTWVTSGASGDSATAMDHNANIVQELEFIIDSNGTADRTVYYFRLFDVHDNTAIFRQQDSATACAGSTACTYPSLDTTPRFTQSAYRFFNNLDSTNVGSALTGGQDQAATLAADGDAFRLRMMLHSSESHLATPSGWTSSNIDSTNDVGQWSSIATVGTSNIFISYYDSTAGNLNLRFCKSTDAGISFSCSDVDTANDYGQYSSITAVDDQTIFISHYDNTNDNLRFCKTTNQGTNWSCSDVSTTNDVGSYTSIAAANDQTIFITSTNHNLAGTSTFAFFCKTTNQGTNWSCSTPDNEVQNDGLWTSIDALDDQTIFLSHKNTDNSDARFCKTTNQGTNWTCGFIENSANDNGNQISLDAVNDQTIFVSYQDSTAGNLNLRFCKTTNQGTNWTCSNAEATNDVGRYSSISALDANNIFISHYDLTNGNLRICKSTDVGANFSCSDVDTSSNDVGIFSSIAAVDGNTVYISYRDQTAGALNLKFAKIKMDTAYFKMQFAEKSTSCDTAFSGETYADLTTSTVLSFKNNPTPGDSVPLTPNVGDPSHSTHGTHAQTYEESNNFTNNVASIFQDEDGLWDFAFFDNTAPVSTSYCFRIVMSDGNILDSYESGKIAEITTAPSAGPTTDQVMRHGNWFNASGVEQGFFWAN